MTRYAITLKLYFLLFSVMGIINGSAMPIIAKEFGVANWVWINSVYSKLLVSSAIIGGLVWLIGVLFSRDIIKLWTGNESNYAGLLTVLALGGYSYLLSMVNLNSNLAATFNFTKYSPWAAWLEACLKIGLSILLLQFFGIAGVALGTFLGSLLAPAWILPLILVKGSEGNLRFDAGFLGKHFVLALLPMLSIAVLTQVFIEDQFLRILFGVCTVFVYLTICARVMPVGVLAYIRRVFNAAIFGIREKLRI